MATQNNKRILHRKEWQMMTPSPANSAAATFIIKDPLGIKRTTLFVVNATTHYLYAADEDAWMQVPSMALAGTWAAGSCGCWLCWSNILTASGGTTTSLTTTTSINSAAYGNTIRFLTGLNAGLEVVCTGFKIIPGGTNTLTFDALPNAVANNDTFVVSSGRYVVLNAYTSLVANVVKTYDPLTGVITALGTTGLPASWGTDGKMCATPSYVGAFATGTATAGTGATTIVNSAKAWDADQWINYQVRITSGTGIGQVRTIIDNDGTSITFAAMSPAPDTSSVYAIEANDNFIYLAGNNAKTLYRYSLSEATWTSMSPTVARATTPSTGMSLNWIGKTGDANWSVENTILDGRYIFSFTGGASSTLDRFDIAGGTAGAGTWNAITYSGKQETFTTGSSFDIDTNKIFCKKDATNRFFYYDVTGNYLYPFSTNMYTDSTAVLGDKLFTVSYSDNSGDNDTITWLYSLMNSGSALHRIMVF